MGGLGIGAVDSSMQEPTTVPRNHFKSHRIRENCTDVTIVA